MDTRGPARPRGSRAPRAAGMARARELFAVHAEAERTGVPAEEVSAARAEARAAARSDARYTRRELLAAGAGAAAAAALSGAPARALARAARRRRSHGSRSSARAWPACAARTCCGQGPAAPGRVRRVYEANPDRVGGRCWTLRDYFRAGSSPSTAASFLNSDQPAVRDLVAQARAARGGRRRRRPAAAAKRSTGSTARLYTYAEARRRLGQLRLRGVQGGAQRDAQRRRAKRGSTRCRCPSGSRAPRSAPPAASAG